VYLLKIDLESLLPVFISVGVVILLALLFLGYVYLSTKMFKKAFLRPKPLPAVDRSPLNIDQSTINGKGRNWFYANRIEFMNVRVEAFDKVKLAGYYRPSFDKTTKNVVILLHGRDEHPSEMGSYAKLLMKVFQCHVLIAHQRAHGMSEGKYCTYGLFESVDLLSWIDFVKRQVGPDCRIYILGRCMGSTAALLAAQQNDMPSNVAGIIADCPYDSADNAIYHYGKRKFGALMSPIMMWLRLCARKTIGMDMSLCDCAPRAGRIKVPVLIFQGTEDIIAIPEFSRRIYDNIRSPKRMITIPGARHLMCYDTATELYEKEVTKFIEQCVILLAKQGRL